MSVEIAGLGGLGVHEETTTADVVGQLQEPSEDVLKQPRTKSAPLVVDVHAEAGKKGHWLGVAAGASANSLRSLRNVDLRHAPGVVRDDLGAVLFANDEDPRRPGTG